MSTLEGAFEYSRHYEWLGRSSQVSGDRVYYTALRTIDDGHVIGINDTVELLSGEGRSPFLALVESFWEDTATGLWKLRTRWYYRPEDLPEKLLASYPLGRPLPGEIFLSGVSNDNDVQCILGKACVLSDGDLAAAAGSVAADPHTFVLRCCFSPRTGAFEPLASQAAAAAALSGTGGPAAVAQFVQQPPARPASTGSIRMGAAGGDCAGAARLDRFAATASYMERQAPRQPPLLLQQRSDSALLGLTAAPQQWHYSAAAAAPQQYTLLHQRDQQTRVSPSPHSIASQFLLRQQQHQQQRIGSALLTGQHMQQLPSQHSALHKQLLLQQHAAHVAGMDQEQLQRLHLHQQQQLHRQQLQQQQHQQQLQQLQQLRRIVPRAALSGAAAQRISADSSSSSNNPANAGSRIRLEAGSAAAAAGGPAATAGYSLTVQQQQLLLRPQRQKQQASAGTKSGSSSLLNGKSEVQHAAEPVPPAGFDAAPTAGCEASPDILWVQYSYPGLLTSMDADVRGASFLQSMRQWYAAWAVRPDVVLKPWKAHPDEKNPTAEYWQDYKKVRIDWRERAGSTKEHFVLIVQHYMRIDGVYKDTCKRSISNIVSRIKVCTTRKRKRPQKDTGAVRKSRALNPATPRTPLAATAAAVAVGAAALAAASAVTEASSSTSAGVRRAASTEGLDGADGDDDTSTVQSGAGADSGDESKPRGSVTTAVVATAAAVGAAGKAASGMDDTVRLKGKHWWEEEAVEGGLTLLYPTSDTHQWSSHNAIEHRIMELEFEDGNDLRPPKDSLIEFALNWRPDSLFRYVMGLDDVTEPLSPLQGMYQRQEALRGGRYWYKLVPGAGVGSFSVALSTAAAEAVASGAAAEGGDSADSDACSSSAAKRAVAATERNSKQRSSSSSSSSTNEEEAKGDRLRQQSSSSSEASTSAGDTHATAGADQLKSSSSSSSSSSAGSMGGSRTRPRSISLPANTAAGDSSCRNPQAAPHSTVNSVVSKDCCSSSRTGGKVAPTPVTRAVTVTLDAELTWSDSANAYVLRAVAPAGSGAEAVAAAACVPAQKCLLQEVPRWEEKEVGSGGGWSSSGDLLVRGCMSLFPPRQMLACYGVGAVRAICLMVWQGCFRANPDRVAFSLFCRLLVAKESPDAAEVSEELSEDFDTRKFAMLRSFLALQLEEGEFVTRAHYLAFMQWALCTAPEQPLVAKLLRLWDAVTAGGIPFAGYPVSANSLALKHHGEILCREGAPGYYCFRFSKRTGYLTVDYSCMESGNGRPAVSVSVASRRLQVVALSQSNAIFRADSGPSEPFGSSSSGSSSDDSTADSTDFSSLVDFVRVWSSRFAVKCETSAAVAASLRANLCDALGVSPARSCCLRGMHAASGDLDPSV